MSTGGFCLPLPIDTPTTAPTHCCSDGAGPVCVEELQNGDDLDPPGGDTAGNEPQTLGHGQGEQDKGWDEWGKDFLVHLRTESCKSSLSHPLHLKQGTQTYTFRILTIFICTSTEK